MTSTQQTIKIIIPAFNEESSIGKVLRDIPAGIIDEVVVVNNNSQDETAMVARKHGATVIDQPKKGYGNACLKGMEYLASSQKQTDIVLFMDADYSDHPEEIPNLLKPILKDGVDMVIGSRALGKREKGAMTLPQIFGNWLATTLLRWLYGVSYTDLGPFRAIKWPELQKLNMQDKTFGWTVEMQLKAAKNRLTITEVPVKYRKRIGKSKISGTVRGTLLAGHKIIATIFKYL